MHAPWTTSLTDSAYLAEQRPDSRKIGQAVAAVWILWAVIMVWGFASPQPLVWIVAIVCACAAAFPTALWLGMRRSRYRVALLFDEGVIQVEEVRSFDPPARFGRPLAAIGATASGSILVMTWLEEPESSIEIQAASPEEAARVAALLVAPG